MQVKITNNKKTRRTRRRSRRLFQFAAPSPNCNVPKDRRERERKREREGTVCGHSQHSALSLRSATHLLRSLSLSPALWLALPLSGSKLPGDSWLPSVLCRTLKRQVRSGSKTTTRSKQRVVAQPTISISLCLFIEKH